MNNFRTVREARINFIFFQDIITCVMGILILVTLMLSLSLGEAATPEEQQLQKELQETKQRLAQTEQQNRSTQEKALRLASLPDQRALETQLAIIQRELDQSAEQLRQSEKSAAALKSQQASALAEQQSATNLQRTIADLQQQLTDARDQIANARQQTNAIYIVPSAEALDAARQPVAFIVSSNKVQLRRFNNAAASQDRNISSAEDLRPLLSSLNPEREYVVFYIRPSGAKWFQSLRSLARSLGFVVGYDAVEEQKQIVFTNE